MGVADGRMIRFDSAIVVLALACLLGCATAVEREPAAEPVVAPPPPTLCNIKDFGAKGDDGIDDTKAIQAAINACAGHGGTVIVPSGTFNTGTLRLASQMTFRLETGALLVALRDPAAFPPLSPPTTNTQLSNARRAVIYAEKADDLVIEGPGHIDGSGDLPAWQNVKESERPMALFVMQGHRLKIQNLWVQRAAMWAVVLMETSGARVSNLNIDSRTGNTRDGLDIVDGDDIRVDGMKVFSEDDAICLKSGSKMGLSKVRISNAHVLGSLVANGLKFGTASVGPVRDIHFENIKIEHVAQAAMAIESVDGSSIKGVTFKNITFSDTGTAIFMLLGWRGDQTKAKPGSISNVTFDSIDGESSRQAWGSAISGTLIGNRPAAIENLIFKNVKLRFKGDDQFAEDTLPPVPPEYAGGYPDPRMWPALPARGLFFRHARHVSFSKVQLDKLPSADARPMMIPDTTDSQFDAP